MRLGSNHTFVTPAGGSISVIFLPGSFFKPDRGGGGGGVPLAPEGGGGGGGGRFMPEADDDQRFKGQLSWDA